jgi:hypothetical protein
MGGRGSKCTNGVKTRTRLTNPEGEGVGEGRQQPLRGVHGGVDACAVQGARHRRQVPVHEPRQHVLVRVQLRAGGIGNCTASGMVSRGANGLLYSTRVNQSAQG